MAQAIFNKYTADGFVASSAGITASDGRPVSENSVLALDEIGISIDHKSEKLSEKHFAEYDYIIGITADHARVIAGLFPDFKDKIFAFPCDVSDPYGGDIILYRKCRDKIVEGVKKIIGALENDK